MVRLGLMICHTDEIILTGTSGTDVTDVTRKARQVTSDCGLVNGLLSVFTPGSTAAVTTIEYEPGAVNDLKAALERLAPSLAEYQHNLRWQDGNGYSHLRSALLGPSVSVPVRNSELCLGAWQQIIVLDFDNKPRQRRVMIQALGE